ncbi:MAG: hypothetical protein AB8B94_19960, partial [Hyphomicrobiales bacterium]
QFGKSIPDTMLGERGQACTNACLKIFATEDAPAHGAQSILKAFNRGGNPTPIRVPRKQWIAI